MTPALPAPRAGRAVYLVGGFFSSSSTELLPADSTTWQQGPTLPFAMPAGPCAVAISSTSFLVFHEKEIREFDASIAGPTSSQGWAKEDKWPKMETSRINLPGCAKAGDDKVIIAGGGDDYFNTQQTTEILDLTSRRISKGGKMATPRESVHIISFNINGDFTTLALGGLDDGWRNRLNTVEEWNPETESWSTVGNRLKKKRHCFGAVAAPKNLVCPSPSGFSPPLQMIT